MNVDTSSATWLAVVKHVEARIEDLKEKCCSVHATDATRASMAARIDELRMLVNPPKPMGAVPRNNVSESY